MFKKLGRALTNKGRFKVRVDVSILDVSGLPEGVTNCRLLWQRESKLQMTKTVLTEGGMPSLLVVVSTCILTSSLAPFLNRRQSGFQTRTEPYCYPYS